LGAEHALLLEEREKMVEPLRGFGQVAATVALESGNIALEDGFVKVADSIALSMQPAAERITGAQIALYTARGIPLLVQAGSQIVQIGSQQTTPQASDYVRPYKEGFEHASLLFLWSCLEKEKDGTSGSCEVG
jgi:hypothetical protein